MMLLADHFKKVWISCIIVSQQPLHVHLFFSDESLLCLAEFCVTSVPPVQEQITRNFLIDDCVIVMAGT